MKKLIAIFIASCIMLALLAGCTVGTDTQVKQNDKLKIVTTIFPVYDWTKAVLGEQIENVDLTMLLDNGVDLHSFQPTTDDMISIANCDIFIYVGGESDKWVEDALKNATNDNMQVINLLHVLEDNVKSEEMVEGMQETAHAHDHGDADEHDHEHEDADEHDHEHEDADEHDHEHEDADEHDHETCDVDDHEHEHEEVDEHVWLSLQNAEIVCEAITNALKAVDENNAGVYTENANAYINQLEELDAKYKEVVENASIDTILFGDRFPFRYLVDDYNLNYYAAFVGCSAETEASFETVTFLAKKVDELKLGTVLTIENSNEKLAKTIISNTNSKDQTILSMNSMQATTSKDVEQGVTYLTIMQSNLEVLTKALQ